MAESGRATLRSFAAIFHALTFRYYRQHPGRFWLCAAGLAAGVAVAGSINLTNARVIESFEESMETLAGDSNLRLRDERGLAPEDLLQLRWLWQYGRFSPYVTFNASYRAGDGELRGVNVYGFDFIGGARLRRFAIQDDEDTSAEGRPALDGLIVPVDSPLGSAGDTVELIVDARARTLRIDRVLENVNGNVPPAGTAYMDLGLALQMRERLSGVDVYVPPVDVEHVRARLAKIFPRAEISTLRERKDITRDMLAAFQMNLQALGVIALLVSAYLVYNTVNISVVQREAFIASLYTLGAGRRDIFLALIAEGVFLGLAGGAIGLVFGYALSLLAYEEVSVTLETVFRLESVRGGGGGLAALFASFGIGIVFAALAAWLPAYRASRSPLTRTRRAGRSEYSPQLIVRCLAGALIFFAVFAGFYELAHVYRSPRPGFGAVAALIGILSFLAPPGLYLAAQLARLFRHSGAARLAAAATREHIVRIAVAVAALAITLSMAGAVSVMVHSFRGTVQSWLATAIVADIYIKSGAGDADITGSVSPGAVATIQAHPQVDEVVTIRSVRTVYSGARARPGGEVIYVGANEMEAASRRMRFSFVEGDVADMRAAAQQGGVIVSEVFANRYDVHRGDSVTLFDRKFTVHGVYRSYSSERGYVMMDVALFGEVVEPRPPTGVAVFVAPGAEPETILRELRGSTKITRSVCRYRGTSAQRRSRSSIRRSASHTSYN